MCSLRSSSLVRYVRKVLLLTQPSGKLNGLTYKILSYCRMLDKNRNINFVADKARRNQDIRLHKITLLFYHLR